MRSPSPPPPALTAPVRFGPFTLHARIGVGGMAEVFRATEPRSVGEPRVVVVKKMLPHVAREPRAHEMFEREALLGERVTGPNVVRVLGHGVVDGQPYLALEYVPGCDLSRLLRALIARGQVLGTELSIFVAREILAGLHATHEATDAEGRPLGIVHRDVSPSNVLLSVHGEVKIGDFGIARSLLAERAPRTPGSIRAKGKLGYVAPETITRAEADRRSDVFSAGVVLAEMLMGRPLFTGGSELAVLLAIRDGHVGPFRDWAARLPRGLGDVVLRALSTDPAARHATAEAFREALAPFEGSGPEGSAPLRRELADRVASMARASIPPRSEETPRLDLESIEATPFLSVGPDAPTPIGAVERTTSPSLSEALADPRRFYVRTRGGAELGPLGFADLVKAVTTRHVDAEDEVVPEGEAPRLVRDLPELERHLCSLSRGTTTRETPVDREPERTIRLEDGGILIALSDAALHRRTGLWLCDQASARKEVYLSEGSVEFVTSNLAGELLGETMVASGMLSRGELDMALAVMPRFDGRLGDTLLELGLVEPMALFRHIEARLRERILDIFLWSGGTATYYEGVRPPPSSFPLSLDPWLLVDQGIARRMAEGLESATFERRLLDPLVALPDALPPAAVAALPPFVAAVLHATATPRPLPELVDLADDPSGADPGRGYRAVVLLLRLGALRWE